MSIERYTYRYYAIPFLILGLSNIICNSLLCNALYKLKKLETISYKLIMIRGIADIVVGVVQLASETTLLIMQSSELYAKIILYTRVICDAFCQFSGSMILIVALDRYIHMKHLIRYNTMMTNRRAAIMIANNVVTTLSMAIVNVCGVEYNYYNVSHLLMNCMAMFSFTTTLIIYYKAYSFLSHRVQNMNLQRQEQPVRTAPKRSNRSKEFSRAIAVILVLLAVCYIPFVIVSAVKMVYQQYALSNVDGRILKAFYCARILICFVPSVNALTFIAFNAQLRNFFMRKNNSNSVNQFSSTI
eukprot:gene17630-19384_t